MVIINQTKNIIVSDQAKIANSFFDRVLGLLNPHNPRFLVINTHFGIHTLFMKTPIDLILLDKNNKVVKISKRLAPNHLFLYHPKYKTIIEMPKGAIENFNISINDKISIE